MTIQTQLQHQKNSLITMYYDDACVLCSTEAHNMLLTSNFSYDRN